MTQSCRSHPVHAHRLFWRISLLLLACYGCGHHEEDEDHHLEHLIPAHKPESFAEAVTELKSRGPAVFAGEATDDAQQELLDIINWLPELAADSDLKRKQWEQVQGAGLELRQLIANPTAETSQSRWNELVEELEELIPVSDTWSQQRHTEEASHSTSTNENSSAFELTNEVPHD